MLRYSLCFILFATAAFAQQSGEKEEFDYAKYRGVHKYIEGLQFEMAPKFSGELKTFQEINKAATKAFNKLTHPAVAYKALAIPAWNQVGGHQGPPLGALNSGRVRDIAFGPNNVAYLATANGGLWKTEDFTGGGSNIPTWVPITDRLPTLSLGSVAVDPSNPNTVYLGTGEKSPDGFDPSTVEGLSGFGDGLYKSNDGGLNWTKICDTYLTGTRISEVLIDPKNPQIVYVACNRSRPNTGTDTSGGILKSTDGGTTWRASNLKGFETLHMVIDPIDPQRLYVSGNGNIFRTSNGGDTWESCKTGITGSVGRISIDISPSNPNVLYASVGVPASGTNGLYISNDNGSTWKKNKTIATDEDNYLWIQPWFANAVAVHPSQPRVAIAGGLNVVRTPDSGKKFEYIGKSGQNIHADIHNIVYNGPSNLFVCSDGGLVFSKNNGSSWVSTLNNGLATLDFVGVDADKNFTFVLGGTQDNGTNRAYTNETTFTEANGGDGGRTWISQLDSNICYTTQYETSFFRSLQAGRPGTWQKVTVGSACPFYPRYDADESGEIIALGATSRVVVSVNGGVDGFAQKSTQTIGSGSNPTRAVRVFPTDPNYMWAGTASSLWRSTDMGLNFTRTQVTNAGSITDIELDPDNKQNIWICSQGYASTNSNVFKSTDGGATVTPLPNFPPMLGANAIVRQKSTGWLFVGTDVGVLFTPDEGQTWHPLTDGMPNAIVNSLKLRGANNDKLLAGTYGRGMYSMDISQLTSVHKKPDANSSIRFTSVYPNPVTSGKVTVSFEMKEGGVMTSTLLDMMGHEVKVVEKAAYGAGANQFEFSTADLASGTYIVLLTANGMTACERIIVN